MAAYRTIPRRPRTAGVGPQAATGSGEKAATRNRTLKVLQVFRVDLQRVGHDRTTDLRPKKRTVANFADRPKAVPHRRLLTAAPTCARTRSNDTLQAL